MYAQANSMFDPTADYLTASHRRARAKRLFDFSMVLATAPVWLAILAVLCTLVKLSDPAAPAIYWQERTGRLGRRFKLAKIRTMCPGADAMRASSRCRERSHGPGFQDQARSACYQDRRNLAPNASGRIAAVLQCPYRQHELGRSSSDIDGTARTAPYLVARSSGCRTGSDRPLADAAEGNLQLRGTGSLRHFLYPQPKPSRGRAAHFRNYHRLHPAKGKLKEWSRSYHGAGWSR